MRLLPICALAYILAACAARTPPATSMPPVAERPANPEAVAHLLAAKQAERAGDSLLTVLEWEAAVRADTASPTLRMGLAEALRRVRMTKRAAQVACDALGLDSAYVPALRFLSEYHRHGGDFAQSAEYMERELRVTGDEEIGWRLVELYRTLRREADVRRVFREMADAPDTGPEDLARWAHLAASRDHKTGAEEIYRTLLSRWPDYEDGVAAYGEFLGRNGRAVEAEALYRRRLAANGDSPEIRRRLSAIYIERGEWARADSVVRAGDDSAPGALEVRKAWASLLIQRDQEALAIAGLEALLRRHPRDADLHALLGQSLLASGQPEQAVHAFRETAAIDSSIQGYAGLIYALVQTHDYPRAEAAAREAISVHPDEPRLRYFLGVSLRAQEHWREAADVFGRLAAEDSTETGTLFDWASSLERAGFFEDAVAGFRRILRLDPNHAAALNYLGYMFAERGVNLNEALELITQAVAEDPTNGAYLDSIGWVLHRLGRDAEAKRYLLEAIRRDANNAIIYEHVGDVCAALGERDEARRFWGEALRLDPQNVQVQSKIERLPAD